MANIVAFVASHVDSPKRLARLGQCLESLRGQNPGPANTPSAFVSWSAETPELAADVGRLAARQTHAVWLQRPPAPSASAPSASAPSAAAPSADPSAAQGRRLSQFQHYKRAHDLASLFLPPDATWVMFSGDEDLSAPDRKATYEAAARAAARMPECASLFSPHYVETARWLAARGPATAAEVRTIIRKNDAKLRVARAEDAEHWQFCVRLSVLGRFLGSAPPRALAHASCDAIFRAFVVSYGGAEGRTAVVAPASPRSSWMYFRRCSADPPADRRLTTDPRDAAAAGWVAADLARAFPRLTLSSDKVSEVMGAVRRSSFLFVAEKHAEIAGGSVAFPKSPVVAKNPSLAAALYYFVLGRCNTLVESMEDIGLPLDDAAQKRYAEAAENRYVCHARKWRDSTAKK